MYKAIRNTKFQRLIQPQSIAVFGGDWAKEVVHQCQKIGYKGELWPVHPRHKTIKGLKVYRSVSELPTAPDAAFIGVNREITVPIVKQLAEAGAGGAVCFSSGYSETAEQGNMTGRDLQTALIDACGDMPILGPNCYGFVNYFDGAALWPDQHGGQIIGNHSQGVAIITQSSNIAINISLQQRGLPIGYLMTVGNQAKVGLSELGLALLEDPKVTCLGLHVEGFDSIRGMELLATRAFELNKPIIILKVGKSEQAQAGMISHTASLSGAHTASRAFIKRLGMAETANIPVFLDTLTLIHWFGPLPGHQVSVAVCSGGEASLIADIAVDKNVTFPPLHPAAKEQIQAVLGPQVTVANPLDFHTYIWADKPQTTAAFIGLLSGDFDLNILIQDFPPAPLKDRGWQITAEALIDARNTVSPRLNKPVRTVMVSTLHENIPNTTLRAYYANKGLVCFGGADELMSAAGASAKVGECWGRWKAKGLFEPLLPPTAGLWDEAWHMNENEAKELLGSFGVRTPVALQVNSLQQATEAAHTIGFPLVAKALGFAHKTEHEAIQLNIQSQDELAQAVSDLLLLSDEILLESMINGALGELILGIRRDPLYGLALTLGLGGTMVELLDECAHLLLPTDDYSIRSALQSLKIAPVFSSFRGQPAWSMNAVVESVLALQSFAIAHQDSVLELDINPLLVGADFAIAADALIQFNSKRVPNV